MSIEILSLIPGNSIILEKSANSGIQLLMERSTLYQYTLIDHNRNCQSLNAIQKDYQRRATGTRKPEYCLPLYSNLMGIFSTPVAGFVMAYFGNKMTSCLSVQQLFFLADRLADLSGRNEGAFLLDLKIS